MKTHRRLVLSRGGVRHFTRNQHYYIFMDKHVGIKRFADLRDLACAELILQNYYLSNVVLIPLLNGNANH